MKHYIHKILIGSKDNFNGAPEHAIYAHYNSYSNSFSFSYHDTTDGELAWCHNNKPVTTHQLHALPIMGIRKLEEESQESYQQRVRNEHQLPERENRCSLAWQGSDGMVWACGHEAHYRKGQ